MKGRTRGILNEDICAQHEDGTYIKFSSTSIFQRHVYAKEVGKYSLVCSVRKAPIKINVAADAENR